MRGRAGALRLESAIEGEKTADAPAPSIVAYAESVSLTCVPLSPISNSTALRISSAARLRSPSPYAESAS